MRNVPHIFWLYLRRSFHKVKEKKDSDQYIILIHFPFSMATIPKKYSNIQETYKNIQEIFKHTRNFQTYNEIFKHTRNLIENRSTNI